MKYSQMLCYEMSLLLYRNISLEHHDDHKKDIIYLKGIILYT